MSAEKPDKNDKHGMDQSATSHTSAHGAGLHEVQVRRLSISEHGDTITEIPTLLVPKSVEELRTNPPSSPSTLDEDLEMQGEMMHVEEQCLSPKCIIFAVVAAGVLFGAIFAIIRMRSNHIESLEEFDSNEPLF